MEPMAPVDNQPFSVDNPRHKGITVAMQSAQTNKTGNTAAKTGGKQAPARKSPRGNQPTGAPIFSPSLILILWWWLVRGNQNQGGWRS